MKSLTIITTILFLSGCTSSTIVGGPNDLGEAGTIGEAGQSPIDETGGLEQTGGTGGSTGGNLPTGGFSTGGNLITGGTTTGGSAGFFSTGGQETGGSNTGGTNVILPAGCQLVSPIDNIDPEASSISYNDCAVHFSADSPWRWQLACCGNANLPPTHNSFAECRSYGNGPYPEAIENHIYLENKYDCKTILDISESVGVDVYCCMIL